MKKVVFALKGMYLGGTEKALLSALDVFNEKDTDVYILLLDHEGALLNDIPNWCKVLYIDNINEKIKKPLLRNGFKDNFKYYVKHFRLIKAFKIFVRRVLFKDLLAEIDGKYKKIPYYEDEFDVAVSYQYHDTFITRYVAEKIKAKKKYVWVHNDLTTTGFNYKYTYPYIENYNCIYSVSKYIETELKNAYPNMSNMISVKYNYLNKNKIILKSNENVQIPWSNEDFSILTVGRLNNQKGYDIAIDSANILKKNNISFKWYFIGDGEEKENLLSLIKKYELENDVILYGSVKNPFPFMKNCNLYVQSSRHEGYCTTTNEALSLSKAVISTRVSGADEQIKDGYNGWIVDIDSRAIADKIIDIYRNPLKINEIETNLIKDNKIIINDYFDFLRFEGE